MRPPKGRRSQSTAYIYGRNLTATARLVVVHHGARESIEAFDVVSRASPPALTWVGCVVGPPNASFNAVVALPGGGIAATNTRPAAGQNQLADADPIGAVWECHAARRVACGAWHGRAADQRTGHGGTALCSCPTET
jgi:hypothetical protein